MCGLDKMSKFNNVKKLLVLISAIATMASTTYILLVFMILEMGINNAYELLYHRGLMNYMLLVPVICCSYVVVVCLNYLTEKGELKMKEERKIT